MLFLGSKYVKIAFAAGARSAPYPAEGAYTRSPRPLGRNIGAYTSKGKGKVGEGRGGKGKGGRDTA